MGEADADFGEPVAVPSVRAAAASRDGSAEWGPRRRLGKLVRLVFRAPGQVSSPLTSPMHCESLGSVTSGRGLLGARRVGAVFREVAGGFSGRGPRAAEWLSEWVA